MDTQDVDEAKFDEQPSVLQKLQKWGDYEAYGGAVAPTNFVPMKTPLGSEILRNWNLEEPPRYPLSVADLLHSQSIQGRKIGMIIDLSNHKTLYGADLKETGVQYQRVPLVAKVFPTQRAVNRVIELAERFWSEQPDLFVAIHCAYGFNRTGFVVCSYLVQACNLTVQEALESFALARPPGIRHEQFVGELHKRYDGFRSDRPIPAPPSLSDLRGFAGNANQVVGSLNSDFLGVAEHLQENHPGLAGRLTASTQDTSVAGNSDNSGQESPLHPANQPAAKGALATVSAVSLEGGNSNCESVNNESLDLDERDIYKHFASRQLPTPLPVTVAANRHHRRKGISPVLPTLRQSEESNHSSKSSPSPFANVQNGRDVFASTLQAEGALESSMGSNEGRNDLGHGVDLQQADSRALEDHHSGNSNGRPPRSATLRRGPITERVIKSSSDGNEAERDAYHQEGTDRRRLLPCRLM